MDARRIGRCQTTLLPLFSMLARVRCVYAERALEFWSCQWRERLSAWRTPKIGSEFCVVYAKILMHNAPPPRPLLAHTSRTKSPAENTRTASVLHYSRGLTLFNCELRLLHGALATDTAASRPLGRSAVDSSLLEERCRLCRPSSAQIMQTNH